jgi:hypothetical protein
MKQTSREPRLTALSSQSFQGAIEGATVCAMEGAALSAPKMLGFDSACPSKIVSKCKAREGERRRSVGELANKCREREGERRRELVRSAVARLQPGQFRQRRT